MNNKPTLSQILADLLTGKPLERPLSGGLMLLYKEPDMERSEFRLFCYRRGLTGWIRFFMSRRGRAWI